MTRPITHCPEDGVGMIPADATEFGGSQRVANHPQLWNLKCHVPGTTNSSEFSYVGQCNEQEISFDGPPAKGTLLNAVCVEAAPVLSVSKARVPSGTPDGVIVNMQRGIHITEFKPPQHPVYEGYSYVQFVFTKLGDRSVPYKMKHVTLKIFGSNDPVFEDYQNCNSVKAEFNKTSKIQYQLMIKLRKPRDLVDVYAFFS